MNVVCMATIPERYDSTILALGSLAEQADEIWLALNEKSRFSAEQITNLALYASRISSNLTNCGDGEKLRLARNDDFHCYFLCDDDIFYPPNYIKTMREAVDRYGSIATVHGSNVRKPFISYYRSRDLLPFHQGLERDQIVDIAGTGTMAFFAKDFDPFCVALVYDNMLDVLVACEAKKKRKPIYAVARPANWLKPIPTKDGGIYEASKHKDEIQTRLIREAFSL